MEPIIKQYNNWDDYNLNDDLLKGIYAYGFDNPSEIQKIAISPIIENRDIIAQAQSGTGKTGTFSIGILESINTKLDATQVIILSPTRELTNQTSNVISKIGQFIPNLKIKTLVGGESIQKDISYLKYKNPHIIVACVGRLCDLIERKFIKLDNITTVCFDEADEMIKDSFKDNIITILNKLKPDVQKILFSATRSSDINLFIKEYLIDPVKIFVDKEKISLECIQQFYIALNNDHDKYDALKYLFNKMAITQCIIYINSLERLQSLYDTMIKDEYPVGCIHSSLERNERENTLCNFRNGKYRVLLSSDITARGIDVQQVGLVINFDVPKNISTYLHRIGRGGRWGRKGNAINFITQSDLYTMRKIENYYKVNIKEFISDDQLDF